MTAHLVDSPRKSREPICKDSKLDVKLRGKGAIYSRNRKVRGGNLVCGDGAASFSGASVCQTQVGAKGFESLVTRLGQGERAQDPLPNPVPTGGTEARFGRCAAFPCSKARQQRPLPSCCPGGLGTSSCPLLFPGLSPSLHAEKNRELEAMS